MAKEGKVFEPKKLLIPLLDTSEGTKITWISLFLTSPTPTVYSTVQCGGQACQRTSISGLAILLSQQATSGQARQGLWPGILSVPQPWQELPEARVSDNAA